MVADVATLHKDTSRLVFHPTCVNPVFASPLISVTFSCLLSILSSPTSSPKGPSVLSHTFTVRIHTQAFAPRTTDRFFLLLFLSHLPLSSSFPHHAGTVISVEKCDAWIFLGDRPTWLCAAGWRYGRFLFLVV